MVHRSRPLVMCLTLALALGLSAAAAAERPLLRFPDVHGDTVVFVHAEEVWTAPVDGGSARRLTDDAGEDRHPKISPDGTMIAWTSQAGGNPDVWVMGIDGANPHRLTFHPGADEVVGWHPTKNAVLFRSNRLSWSRFDRLFLIAPDGTGLEVLPLHEAGRGAISPDGRQIAYNRIAREDRTWKRYAGGMAQDVWLYDFETATDRRLTDFRGTDRLPMWVGGRIYFASDRNGPLEIWSMASDGGDPVRVAGNPEWDLRRPSSDGRRIVYEAGGDLWLLDPGAGSTRRLEIAIPTPLTEARPYRRSAADAITDLAVSPQGGRILLSARGEVFSVPAEHGPTRNLSRTPGARDKDAVWSPDGSTVAWFSDADGEYDVWVAGAAGDPSPRRVTDLGPGHRHTLRFAPDSRTLAFADQTLSVHTLDLATGKLTKVDTSEREPMDVSLEVKPISDFVFSPDSRWLAYSKIGLDMVSTVWLYELETGERHQVSSGRYYDFGPAFTADGRHLLFVSNRRFDPTFDDFEWEMVYKKVAGIYAVTLAADGEALLPPRSDEIARADADDEDGPPARGGDAAAAVSVRVDPKGLTERVEPLPLPRGNYRSLAVAGRTVLYLDADDGDFNAFELREKPPRRLGAFDLDQREASVLRAGVDGYAVAADGEHVAWWSGEEVGLITVGGPKPPPGMDGDDDVLVDLSAVEVVADPRAEWRQVYDEAWRMERDFFYDPGMHGLDWPALGAKYRALVDRATAPQDLRFIIGELIGELATSHTYVGAGDRRHEAATVDVGMLGADWEAAGDRWRITRIYDVADYSRGILPPLAGPGIDVRSGDELLAVDGVPVTTEREVYAAFQGLAGHPVRLTFRRARPERTFEVQVVPLASEAYLRYHAWVEDNRRRVAEASGGRLGYIHLPDTYMGSAVEFPKQYHAQVTKDGLVIDGRYNGGGLDPDIFLSRLAKRPLSYWTRRYSADQATPWYVSRARMVLLTNRQAGSGGDELPFEFRAKGMGPVIGTRTWGGLVGVSMFLTMMDGAFLTAPDYRIYSPDGEWVVENEGVTPDIIVENDPAEMARGRDAQLETAIEVLLERLAADPVAPVSHPPFPERGTAP